MPKRSDVAGFLLSTTSSREVAGTQRQGASRLCGNTCGKQGASVSWRDSALIQARIVASEDEKKFSYLHQPSALTIRGCGLG
jgi:hypothetical protein